LFEPTIKEIEATLDYACGTATEWVKDLLTQQQGNITEVAKIAGISTFKCQDIKKNCGIIDSPRMAVKVLKRRETYQKAAVKDNFKPAEYPVVIGVEPGRGLNPPKGILHA
jgi:hypothetical protein